MSFVYYLFFGIIIVCLLIDLFILGKRIPDLKLLDLSSLKEEKESRTKRKIITERLNRRVDDVKKKINTLTKPAVGKISDAFKNFHDKILDMSEDIDDQKNHGNKIHKKQKIDELKQEAEMHMGKQEYKEAEETLIAIIGLDSKNISAYKDLSEIYIHLKDFDKAYETLLYILKLEKERSKEEISSERDHAFSILYDTLGFVAKSKSDYKNALKYYNEAVSYEPKNPKYLDEMLEISIIVKDKKIALDTLHRLKMTDSDNKKIRKYSRLIKKME